MFRKTLNGEMKRPDSKKKTLNLLKTDVENAALKKYLPVSSRRFRAKNWNAFTLRRVSSIVRNH